MNLLKKHPGIERHFGYIDDKSRICLMRVVINYNNKCFQKDYIRTKALGTRHERPTTTLGLKPFPPVINFFPPDPKCHAYAYSFYLFFRFLLEFLSENLTLGIILSPLGLLYIPAGPHMGAQGPEALMAARDPPHHRGPLATSSQKGPPHRGSVGALCGVVLKIFAFLSERSEQRNLLRFSR